DKWADSPDRSYLNDEAAVIVTVQNTLEEDLLTVAENVKNYVDEFNEKNDIVQATIIRDGSEILQQRMALLRKNGIQGFVIVLLLLAMFLHWRLAFWVALAIPISFAGMFLVANMLDITFNVISLFGMIIVIGILVDDGIVIGENIYQQYEKGVPRFKAALDGTMQVLPAVFAAIITTIIAFATFLFLDGSLGDFFREMSIVVIFSLVFSMIEGAVILPTHVAHSKALQHDREPNMVQRALDSVMNFMRDKLYAPALRFSMQNKILTISLVIGALILTIGSVGGGVIRSTFFPVVDRDNINITLQMPAGTREQVTEQWLMHLENAAKRANDRLSQQFFNGEKQAIERIQRTVGPSTFRGSIDLAILDGESRDPMTTRDVINAIREEAGPIPQAEIVTYGSQSAFGKPISVSLVGSNYEQLDRATEAVKQEMTQLAELVDVVDNNQEGLREINITLKEKARYLGLNLQEVLGQVRSGFFGSEVQRLQRGRDEVRVWVRYDETDRRDITQLQDMRVRFADGREYPLSEIANLEIERGVININHLDGKREVKIEADVANDGVSVSDLTSSLQEDILPRILAGYPGVEARFEGQNREQLKSAKSMMIVGPVMLGLMFFVIALTFRSINQTIAVFLLIPFGLIGVGWGHWLLDKPISLFSILGFIALIGILVNDALVFVSTFNDNIRDGQKQMDALYNAGISRFRPIVLTSVTTFAGLAPLLFEKSLQAQFLIPMAISVSFGLLATTVIILLILPAFLILNNRLKVYIQYAWNGKKPTYTEVEPAAREMAETEH
ncbi:MAG: efflux RND transporter permease subunit, partial [Lewinella sp.]|nr:efflux RND transporter permease subunit [Lewinella sp.]